MSISQWGIFPGWWSPVSMPNGSYPIHGGAAKWQPCGFDDLCAAIESCEQRAVDELAELRRQRRAFLDS